MTTRVAVLMGGWSVERDVSLVSGAAVSMALRELGYEVRDIDVDRDLARRLTDDKPDVAFNALHGRWGEDGCIQGVCEVLDIPYTHSGVMASALAMDKPMAKRLFEQVGISCPAGLTVGQADLAAGHVMDPPYVVKPFNEGSSLGVQIVADKDVDHANMCQGEGACGRFLVEQFIPGRELTVAVMDGEALGVLELRPKSGFYDYRAKYTEGLVDHVMPAEIDPGVRDEALRMAALAHDTLGCRGVSRADFRYDDTGGEPGGLYLLEINTQPGMTPLSLVPEIAAHRGIDFNALVAWMVEDASCGR
ncbi:MAG: D-alanine--D-alanine ligase [Sphingomonadales bacterium]